MSALRESLFGDAHRKLVEGTEVLRTGGGVSLTAGECNAILDQLAELERSLVLGKVEERRLRGHVRNLAFSLAGFSEDKDLYDRLLREADAQ